MNAHDPSVASRENWLLGMLPEEARLRIIGQCETISVPIKAIIVEPEMTLDYAYFPLSGCLSVVSLMENGGSVEVGTIGWEGMFGLSLLHGITSISQQCIAQVPGDMRRIRVDALLNELGHHAELRAVLNRYAEVWINQVSRGGSCNSVHPIEQRCARWLLLTHDRVESDLLPLTQEFLAIMLGVRRASVTSAAASLQKRGAISYKHGKITVLDRAGLEAASCVCYGLMQQMYQKQLSDGSSESPNS
ncbi:MAG: transcriptional regulator, Crp/Fnr family [Gemmatimonadetes bacterium]|nr:transcriptional regulator, Crp/Fnr family [Gemmatimonadota bacterium]